MVETVYKAKKPFRQDGKHYYPITTHDQIIMPDGNRWDGQHLSSDIRDEAAEVGSIKVNADLLGGIAAANYALKEDLNFVGLKSDEREGSAGEEIEEIPIIADNSQKLAGKTLNEIIPDGGTTGQILTKISDINQDTGWVDPFNGITMQLLWENASTTSNFGAQTLIVPGMSEYEAIMIYMHHNKDSGTNNLLDVQFFIPRIFDERAHLLCDVRSGSDGTYGCRREVTVAFEKETLDWVSAVQANSENRNDRMIPIQIYGLRGIL